MDNRSIGDYGLLSDRHSAALVSADGSVDWLCWPRFDSPAVFAALLGRQAGRWTIQPTGAAQTSRRYVDATMVLETAFTTADGVVTVTDALAAGSAGDPHRLGADAPHVLIRQVHCAAGTVEMGVLFQPRPEYGLITPILTGVDGLAGGEGAFLICTFWLARANALAGCLDTAREIFTRAIGYANDLGLLAEQVDPATGGPLGNFPQAYSHIGLINTAYTIAEAERHGEAG